MSIGPHTAWSEAFDAQLSATEIVRRCERRIAELVHEGQRTGTVATRGSVGASPVAGQFGGGKAGNSRGDHLLRTSDLFGHPKERRDAYVLADTPADKFEQAIAEAREEGNLSRANVVRKVKGER